MDTINDSESKAMKVMKKVEVHGAEGASYLSTAVAPTPLLDL